MTTRDQGCSRRQVDRKLRAFIHGAGDFHSTAVRFDKGLHEAQAQTESALRTAFVAAVETVPYFPLFLRRNSHAVVARLDSHFIGVPMRLNADLAAWSGVLQSIVQQVREDLANSRRVDDCLARLREIRGHSNLLLF